MGRTIKTRHVQKDIKVLDKTVTAAEHMKGAYIRTRDSAEVEAYEPLIRQYARQYGIEEYVELIKAVMMQESGGQGSDPMQASECGYNTRYPNTPNGITDPEYSIDVGIQNLAACLREADVESPVDMNHITLPLQGD